MSAPYRFSGAGQIDVKSVSALDDGDLLIAGLSADFEVDRENEAFTPGAFRTALSRFLRGPATLCYVHRHEIALGKVLTAEVTDYGVEITARVDRQLPGSPYFHLYEQVRKGTLSALSWGGYFGRETIDGQRKITGVELLELSICPNGVGRNTRFEVLAGKALSDEEENMHNATKSAKTQLQELSDAIDGLQDDLRKPAGFSVGLTRRSTAATREEARKAAAADYEPRPIPAGAQVRWDEHRREILRHRYEVTEEARRNGEDEPIWFDEPPVNVPRWFAVPDQAVTHTFRPAADAPADGEIVVRDGWNIDGSVVAPTDPAELEFTAEETFALDGPDREKIITRARRRFVEKFLRQKTAYDDELVPVVIHEQSAEQQLAAFAAANPQTNAGRAEWQRRADDLDMAGLAHGD